jgi:hypothetical protein
MNKGGISVVGLAFVVLLLSSSAIAAQPPKEFATYKVSISSPSGERSVLVNETVSPSSKAGYSDLTLQFLEGVQNLTYSRVVNASGIVFPYLPSVANQSLQYSNGTTYRIRISITSSGTTKITFNGSSYTMNVLTVSVSASFFGNKSFGGSGTVETFPSSLVYSASVGNSTAKLQAVLQATNLPLVLSSSAPEIGTAAYTGAGIGIGAVAVGAAFLLRRRGKKVEKSEEKPLHWVD